MKIPHESHKESVKIARTRKTRSGQSGYVSFQNHSYFREANYMKLAGILLLVCGLILVLAAIALLHSSSTLNAFVIAGFAVQVLGLVLMFRSHLVSLGENQ